MTRHDPRLAIEQMISYAREAEAVACGFTAETLAADRLIHGYDGVDLAITLEICHRDLPKLRIALGDGA